jgi:hypothetical protein
MKRSQKHALGAILSVTILGLSTAVYAAESAQATAGLLRMEIMSNCTGGNAFFRVRNAGEAWPKSGTFAIYHLTKKGKRLISKRRMRLKDGQRASFKVKTAKLPSGRLGLWIKPGWYKRAFAYDATVNCS